MVPLKVPDNISLNDRCYASSIAFEEEDNDKIDLLLPNTGRKVRLKQGYQMYAHDYHAKERDLDVNDPVFLRDFSSSSPKLWQKGTMEKDGCVVRHHQDHLRKDPSFAEHSLQSATRNLLWWPQIQSELNSSLTGVPPLTPEAEQVCPARNWHLPVRFKDYELKH